MLTLGWFLCGILLGSLGVVLVYGFLIAHEPELVARTAELFTDGDSLAARVTQLEDDSAVEDAEHPLPLSVRVQRLERTGDLVEIPANGEGRPRVTWLLGATLGELLDRVAKLENGGAR